MIAIRTTPAAACATMRRLLPHLAAALVVALAMRVDMCLAQGQDAAAADATMRSLQALYQQLEEALVSGEPDRLRATFSPNLPPEQAYGVVADLVSPDTTRAVVKERDRFLLPDAPPGTGYRLVLEIFVEAGNAGRIATYRVDVVHPRLGQEAWVIGAVEEVTRVDGLYRLALDPSKQINVKGLRLVAEDYELSLPQGVAFVARVESEITAMVLVGDGTLTFSPAPQAEKVQVKVFCGSDSLVAPFTMAFVRLNPYDLQVFFNKQGFTSESAADPRVLARANEFFTSQVSKSFSLDLSDLSRDTWSLLPSSGDLVVDARTRKYNVLTYAHSGSEAEDITLFDRASRRNIAVYPSAQRLQARGGRSFNEDELADYNVTEYDIQASYDPERAWLEGRTRLRLLVRSVMLGTITLKLAEPLVVRSVQSDRDGRLLSIRVRDQNNVLVSLPRPATRDDEMTLTVTYGGRLEAQPPDREVVGVAEDQVQMPSDMPQLMPEPRWVLSNRSYWYPQNTMSDYATGVLRLTVPSTYTAVASGDAAPGGPRTEPGTSPTAPSVRVYEFDVGQPARYFAWVISKLLPAGVTEVALPEAKAVSTSREEGLGDPSAAATGHGGQGRPSLAPLPGVYYRGADLIAVANPRQVARARTVLGQSAEILSYYASLVDDLPYPSFTLALVDDELPGGHSPAYLAMVHQPLPTSAFSWRNDPVYFDDYPRFFLAHEVAHQFWGQAVGWKSYHEQWISEGFSQFFALLYAEHQGGANARRSVLARLRSTAIAQSPQGPIELGYRLGHIKNDSRVFRSLVYNKAALVLHMLRRFLGDEVFFEGLKQFYRDSRFLKVGTDEVREAFETVSGKSLTRFFQRWIREYAVPTVRYGWSVQGSSLVVTFEQDEQAVHDFPVTVEVEYGTGERQEFMVPVTQARTTVELPAKGGIRGVDVNDDNGTLAKFEKR